MFIRFFIKTLPLLLIINVYGSDQDSSILYNNLGLEYINIAKPEISEIYFKKAIDYSNDSNLISYYLHNLGLSLKRQGKYKLALKIYHDAELHAMDDEILSKIYTNKGIIFKNFGDYKKALLLQQKALNQTNNEMQKAVVLNNIATINYKQQDYNLALRYYLKSLNIKERIAKTQLASAYLNVALCYQELEENKNAKLFFEKSIQNRLKLFGKNHYRLIKAYTNYGDFLIDKDPQKAYKLLYKANNLSLLNLGKKNPETAKTYYYLGKYYSSLKNNLKSLECYQKALISNSLKLNNLNIYANPLINEAISELEQIEMLHQKAIALNKYAKTLKTNKNELEASLKTYELAIKTLFKLQNSFMDESKRTLISNKKNLFIEAAQVAILLEDYSKAFQFIEKGKASTLLASLNNNQAIKYSNIPDSLVVLENEYKRLQFVHSANNNFDSLLVYQVKYDSLISYFENHYPKYYKLKYRSNITDPTKFLKANQVILEFATSDTLCIIIKISKNEYKHYSFSIDSTFNSMLENYINSLKNYNLNGSYLQQRKQYSASAYYLWKKLIKPLEISANTSLIIIPDGKLSYVAFEAFLTSISDSTSRNYYDLNYLLYQYPISYAYSSEWLSEPFLGNLPKNIGAFAHDYRGKDSLLFLSNTVPIAKKITRYFQGSAFLNEDCTKDYFFKHAKDYKIIHIGLHGDILKEKDNVSKLIFDDDNMFSWEIYGINLNTRLVYLSACNTGDGELDEGEGIFSMGRAFAYAGSNAIVSSLWAEKDNLPGITYDFYKYLKKGYSLDNALQKAKINHIKAEHRAHPYFWANKILMGKAMPIKIQPYFWLIILTVIICIIGFLSIKFIKKA